MENLIIHRIRFFLISKSDVTNEKYGFITSTATNSKTRVGTPTKYAVDFRKVGCFEGATFWWLRSSENEYDSAVLDEYMYRVVNNLGACNHISNYLGFRSSSSSAYRFVP